MGKGKAGGAGGGKAGGKNGTKGDVFDGTCHYCGKNGHRQNACRQLDKLMADKGKGKGKGLRELSAEEDEAGAEEDEEGAGDLEPWPEALGSLEGGPEALAA